MPKGQDLSHYQQKIVRRYYNNIAAITLGRLQELASEAAVIPPGEAHAKRREKIWSGIGAALVKAKADPARSERICTTKDASALAVLVASLSK